MSNYPKWLTPERKQALIDLFNRSRGFCVFGHSQCQYPEHHYINYIEGIIQDWQADDREARGYEWRLERKLLHSFNERRLPIRGEFNNIGKDIFYDSQPTYYIIGYAVSGTDLIPFVKIRIPSTYLNLHISLGDTLRKLNKNKRRKAVRYNKTIPEVNRIIDRVVQGLSY